jgi:hypothetical protein
MLCMLEHEEYMPGRSIPYNFHSEVKDFFDYALAKDFKKIAHDYYEEIDAGHFRQQRSIFLLLRNGKI